MMQKIAISDQERESIVGTPLSPETNRINFLQDPSQNLISFRRDLPDMNLRQPRRPSSTISAVHLGLSIDMAIATAVSRGRVTLF